MLIIVKKKLISTMRTDFKIEAGINKYNINGKIPEITTTLKSFTRAFSQKYFI